MIIKINNTEYSGKIDTVDRDYLSVVIFSDKEFNYLSELIGKTKTIEIIEDDAVTGNYDISHPVSFSRAANGVYIGKFAIKDNTVQELQNKIDELNATIDNMLIAMLEA